MYCHICGKETNNGNSICDECQKNQELALKELTNTSKRKKRIPLAIILDLIMGLIVIMCDKMTFNGDYGGAPGYTFIYVGLQPIIFPICCILDLIVIIYDLKIMYDSHR